MSHATTAFHELYLFLIDLENATIAVGLTVEADNEAVAQRAHLEIVADSCHGTALRHDVAEMAHQLKQTVFTQGIGILVLDTGYLTRDAAMHVIGRQLIEMAKRVFQGIFRCPYPGGKFIAVKVLQRGLVSLLIGVGFLFHCYSVVILLVSKVKHADVVICGKILAKVTRIF